jgi:hypothetical protein
MDRNKKNPAMQREQKHGGHKIHRHSQAQPSDPCTESVAMVFDGANEIDDHHEKIDGRTKNNCTCTSFLKVMHHRPSLQSPLLNNKDNMQNIV